MPKLSNKPVSLKKIDKVLEGKVIQDKNEQEYSYIYIPSLQISFFADKVLFNLVEAYREAAKKVIGDLLEAIQSQLRIAETLQAIVKKMLVVNRVNIVIRVPITDETKLALSPGSQLQPTQIFVQPDHRYIPTKIEALPSPNRKKMVSLTKVQIEGNGFAINDEYIHGMTRDSKPGRLFELFIQKDVAGIIPDALISEVLDIESGDYRARGFVLRDLKEILAGNKLKLNLERYRAIGKYKLKAITQYIRKPRKKKKVAKTMQSN